MAYTIGLVFNKMTYSIFKTLFLGLLILLQIPFAKGVSSSKTPEDELIYYSADFINADLLTQEASLKGNVQIMFGEYELNAKNTKIFKNTKTLEAWGDVKIEGRNAYIEAERVNLNYQTKKGSFNDVRIISGQLLLKAKKIYKESEDIYTANNASFTTCLTCPAAWRIKSKKLKTNIKKYIEVKGGRLQILNQSILPLPHLVLPINTRRKTGFIPPSHSRLPGNVGTELAQPYFWAIDPHKDLTFTPKVYYKGLFEKVNGFKLHTEYNQWLTDKSRLKLNSALMYDDAYIDVNLNPAPSSRWFINYENFFVLPNDIIQKSNLTLVRERTYLRDFISEVYGRGESALKNSFSLNKVKENRFTSLEIIYYTNLLTEDPFDDNNTSIHKIPEIRHSISETSFLKDKLLFKSDIIYTNFFRNSKSFDEIIETPSIEKSPQQVNFEGDNLFNPDSDLIRTGHRLRLSAEVSAPFRLGKAFDFLPSLKYKDSYYSFNIENNSLATTNTDYSAFAYSRYLETGLSIKTELSKVLNEKYKHKIIPEIKFKLGTNIENSDHFFFQSQGSLPFHRQTQPITDDDFFDYRHGVQFDYWDRFFRAEVAELSLTNILIKKKAQDFITYYDQPFYLNFTQSYDFRNARLSQTPDPWSNLNGRLKIETKNFSNLTQSSYFYKSKRINISTRNKFTYLPGKFITIGYSDIITVDAKGQLTGNRTKNVDMQLGWEFQTLKISGQIAYSLLEKKHLGWNGNFFYTPRGNCWGIKLNYYQLADLDDKGFKATFFFRFGEDAFSQQSYSL